MLKNTVIVTIVVAVGQLLTSAMAGFAFSYLNFRGREVIFKVFLFAVMIPFHVMLIPTFSNYERHETVELIVGIDFAVYCISIRCFYDAAKLYVSSKIIRRSSFVRWCYTLGDLVENLPSFVKTYTCNISNIFFYANLE